MNSMYFFVRLFILSCILVTNLSADYFITPSNGKTYALEMVDPIVFSSSDHQGIFRFFKEFGYVVVDDVSEKQHRDNLVQLMDQIIQENIPHARRVGFMDLYHDNTLAELRQNPKLYEIFATLFETKKLWVVYDRVIYQAPGESDEPLNPHVDQNPVQHPGFSDVQAMLALRDMDEFTGTLALMPKSHLFFQEYAAWVKPGAGYVEHQGERPLQFKALRLKEGQIVLWDSRTTHSRFRAEAKSNRYAALLTFLPAKDDPELAALRLKCFEEGIGCSNHDAGLRATARPRCEVSLRKNSEQLTSLGRKLYGFDTWK